MEKGGGRTEGEVEHGDKRVCGCRAEGEEDRSRRKEEKSGEESQRMRSLQGEE